MSGSVARNVSGFLERCALERSRGKQIFGRHPKLEAPDQGSADYETLHLQRLPASSSKEQTPKQMATYASAAQSWHSLT